MTTATEDRTARIDAYKAVRAMTDEFRGVKLTDAEAEAITWAAEGRLLANDINDKDAQESLAAFETLMDDLEAGRWSEMIGTPEYPGAATRLRSAFAECGPKAPETPAV